MSLVGAARRWIAAMSYSYNIENREGYIRVEVRGHRKLETADADNRQLWSDVARAAEKSGIMRILAICRMTGPFLPLVIFDLADNPQQIGWTKEHKVALVDGSGAQFEDWKTVETVAINRGFNVRAFETTGAAEDWLLED